MDRIYCCVYKCISAASDFTNGISVWIKFLSSSVGLLSVHQCFVVGKFNYHQLHAASDVTPFLSSINTVAIVVFSYL